MSTLEQFKQLATTPEAMSALASEYILDEEKTTAKIIQMAASKGFELTPEEIIQHINQMQEDDELSDLELSIEALSAVAGGIFSKHRSFYFKDGEYYSHRGHGVYEKGG